MSEAEQPKDNKQLTPEEIANVKKQLDAEIKDAQGKLVSEEVRKEIEDAAKKAKEQAKVEFEKDQMVKEQERKIKELEDKLKQKEVEANEKLMALTKKVDDMASSKAIYSPADNPFNKQNSGSKIDLNDYEQYRELEARSRDLFLKEKMGQSHN